MGEGDRQRPLYSMVGETIEFMETMKKLGRSCGFAQIIQIRPLEPYILKLVQGLVQSDMVARVHLTDRQ